MPVSFHRAIPRYRDALRAWYADAGRPARMAELGVAYGESAEIWVQCGVEELICVDAWQYGPATGDGDSEAAFAGFMARVGHLPHVHVIRAHSWDGAVHVPDQYLDAVYIDAGHTYDCVRRDIAAWLPKVKPTGYVGGHDLCPGWPGVEQAVREFFDFAQVKLYPDNSWLAPKTGMLDHAAH